MDNAVREAARDVLESALTRIETTGWTRFTVGNQLGPNCLTGAIYFAGMQQFIADPQSAILTHTTATEEAYRVVAEGLGRASGFLPAAAARNPTQFARERIINFNDYRCHTQEQAAETLRTAIKKLGSEHV